jgi:hypothetical protein
MDLHGGISPATTLLPRGGAGRVCPTELPGLAWFAILVEEIPPRRCVQPELSELERPQSCRETSSGCALDRCNQPEMRVSLRIAGAEQADTCCRLP